MEQLQRAPQSPGLDLGGPKLLVSQVVPDARNRQQRVRDTPGDQFARRVQRIDLAVHLEPDA